MEEEERALCISRTHGFLYGLLFWLSSTKGEERAFPPDLCLTGRNNTLIGRNRLHIQYRIYAQAFLDIGSVTQQHTLIGRNRLL